MKCKYFEHLLTLQAAGLLKENQIKELARHMQECKRCQAYQVSVERGNNLIYKLKTINPPTDKVNRVTEKVMAAVEKMEKRQHTWKPIDFINHLFYILDNKKVKYSLAGISIILGFFFIVQQTIIYHEIKRLHGYLKKTELMKNEAGHFQESKLIFMANRLKTGSLNYETLYGLPINEEDLNTILLELEELKKENELLKRIIKEKIKTTEEI